MKRALARFRAAPLWVKGLFLVAVVGVVIAIAASGQSHKMKVSTDQATATTTGELDDTETLPPGTLPPNHA